MCASQSCCMVQEGKRGETGHPSLCRGPSIITTLQAPGWGSLTYHGSATQTYSPRTDTYREPEIFERSSSTFQTKSTMPRDRGAHYHQVVEADQVPGGAGSHVDGEWSLCDAVMAVLGPRGCIVGTAAASPVQLGSSGPDLLRPGKQEGSSALCPALWCSH